jgi:trimethylamine--corrinoid protein Co-methyltransferase
VEASLQILTSALSGASLVHDCGFLNCADIGSTEYLVMIDEIIDMVKRIMRGIEVNHETIMLDLIEEIGPGRHFIDEPRSAALCRREIWVPTLMDRDTFISWEQKGCKRMETRIRERLSVILANHEPPTLTPEVHQQINAILQEAEKRY